MNVKYYNEAEVKAEAKAQKLNLRNWSRKMEFNNMDVSMAIRRWAGRAELCFNPSVINILQSLEKELNIRITPSYDEHMEISRRSR